MLGNLLCVHIHAPNIHDTKGGVFTFEKALYLVTREEPYSIFESALRFWPMTVFGIVYAIINTVTYQGFMYNEASIVAPVENISNGSSVILLVIAYVLSGNVDSVWDVLSGYIRYIHISLIWFIPTAMSLSVIFHMPARSL